MPFGLVDESKESLYGRETERGLRSAYMSHIIYIYFSPINNEQRGGWGVGGGVRFQTFFFIPFSLFSRPRVGLATVYSSFFGLATNTLR